MNAARKLTLRWGGTKKDTSVKLNGVDGNCVDACYHRVFCIAATYFRLAGYWCVTNNLPMFEIERKSLRLILNVSLSVTHGGNVGG